MDLGRSFQKLRRYSIRNSRRYERMHRLTLTRPEMVMRTEFALMQPFESRHFFLVLTAPP